MNDVLSFLEQLIFVLDVNVDVTKNDSENGNDHISIENEKKRNIIISYSWQQQNIVKILAQQLRKIKIDIRSG